MPVWSDKPTTSWKHGPTAQKFSVLPGVIDLSNPPQSAMEVEGSVMTTVVVVPVSFLSKLIRH